MLEAEGCSHRASKADTDAGYEACMFCIETGGCDGKKGYCHPHRVVWDVWADRMADAKNSAF